MGSATSEVERQHLPSKLTTGVVVAAAVLEPDVLVLAALVLAVLKLAAELLTDISVAVRLIEVDRMSSECRVGIGVLVKNSGISAVPSLSLPMTPHFTAFVSVYCSACGG
jgi:hypothetical protein